MSLKRRYFPVQVKVSLCFYYFSGLLASWMLGILKARLFPKDKCNLHTKASSSMCLQIFLLKVPVKLCNRRIYFGCSIHKGDQTLRILLTWYPAEKPAWNLLFLPNFSSEACMFFSIKALIIVLKIFVFSCNSLWNFGVRCWFRTCAVLSTMHGTQNLVSKCF